MTCFMVIIMPVARKIPYVATDLQLGIHPARLTNIQQVYEDDVIDGFFPMVKIFNTYSKVLH